MTDAPIIISQLGRSRQAAPAEVDSRPLIVLTAAVVAAAGLAGAVAAPLIDGRADLPTLVVRALVVGAFALAGVSAVARRPSERQGSLVVVAALLGGTAVCLDAVITAHSHGEAVSGAALALARLGEPLALAALPVMAMHLMLGLPDGSCRLGRTMVAVGYAVGLGVGMAVWSQRPSLPLWPIGVEALVALPIGIVGSQRRYARSMGLERQRLQWFGWAVTVGFEALLVSLALRMLWGWPTRVPLVVAVACLPVAVAVALCSSRRANRIDRL